MNFRLMGVMLIACSLLTGAGGLRTKIHQRLEERLHARVRWL